MAQFPANPTRIDPYKNFKFRLKWDGNYVAGISRVSPLKKVTHVVNHRDGGDPHTMRKSPGQTDWEPIVLERGVTHDEAFEQWANKVWDYKNSAALGQEVSLSDFRKDVILEFYNEAGQLVISYNIYRAWVSEFIALPQLDGAGNEVAIQSITLVHEGWDRDTSVQPPKEPSFTDPSS